MNKILSIFKVEYSWFEGEYGEMFLAKDVEQKQFEKDLVAARVFAEKLKGKKVENYDYLGKGYSLECLPQYYNQLIWYLTNKKGYVECLIDKQVSYEVDESSNNKISIERNEIKIRRSMLKKH
ncbi:MAG: hypothetical protein Q8O89_00895 [Nanoarchaeota archaeon]|nr:hypothetical protein [Nanoarchaeota archaeon]